MIEIWNIFEPLAIILIFTITALANRQSSQTPPPTPRHHNTPVSPLSRASSPAWPDTLEHCLPHPPTASYHSNSLSRLLRRLPYLLEICYWALNYFRFQQACAWTAAWINADPVRKPVIEELAKTNAIALLSYEKAAGIDFELGIYRFVLLSCKPWVMAFMNGVRASQTILVVAVLGYSYTSFDRKLYKQIRRTLAVNNYIAFAILTLYRCTPPRLMPPSFGFSDVLHRLPGNPALGGPLGITNGILGDLPSSVSELIIAAMPSLHFSTSLLIGCALAVLGKHWYLRFLAPFYPVLMFYAVLATANNWVLDCLVGAVVTLAGWNLSWVMLLFWPVEEMVFFVLGIERPKEDEPEQVEEEEGREYHLVRGQWVLI